MGNKQWAPGNGLKGSRGGFTIYLVAKWTWAGEWRVANGGTARRYFNAQILIKLTGRNLFAFTSRN